MDNDGVKIEKLKGIENWALWKFQVQVLILASDALGVVSGETPRPEPTASPDATEAAEHQRQLKVWQKADSAAQKLTVTTISEQQILHIINCTSAKEMWDKLHEIFGKIKAKQRSTFCYSNGMLLAKMLRMT